MSLVGEPVGGIGISVTVAVMSVAVVTDSTACLPPEVVRDLSITVVPVSVTLNGVSGAEGRDVTTADMAKAFQARRVEVSTSRPAAGELEHVYQRLLDAGANNVVSVHLSSKLSGTYDSAVLAAREFDDRVRVIDSANVGMGLGFAAWHAATAASNGRSVSYIAERTSRVAKNTSTFFYVDTLEFLRRGGRISAAGALLGTALAVKPILHVSGGKVELRDKVRTTVRALSRLEDLVAAAGDDSQVDIAVHHLQSPQTAEDLAGRLRQRMAGQLRELHITEVGAVIAAHCGPGLLGAVVRRV